MRLLPWIGLTLLVTTGLGVSAQNQVRSESGSKYAAQIRTDAGDREALIGTWKIVSYEDRNAAGNSVFPYGRAPAGSLIYDANGQMAVQLMKTPPPQVQSDDWDLFTIPEKVALFDGYVAYFGRYEVDETRKVVTHLAEGDLSRLYIGRREERHYTLSGDRLTLRETWTQSGVSWSGVRVFERVKPIQRKENATEELKQLERDWVKASVQRDREWLQQFLADEFISTHPTSGILKDKTREIAETVDPKMAVESMKLGDMNVRLLGDVAIVTGRSSEIGGGNHLKDTDRSYLFTDTFIRRDGRWQLLASHSSRISADH